LILFLVAAEVRERERERERERASGGVARARNQRRSGAAMAVTARRLRAVVACVVLAAVAAAPRPAAGILDPNDFLALQAVRRSLDDMPGSAFFDGWDFTADPCGFPGVFCDGDWVASPALRSEAKRSCGMSEERGEADMRSGARRIEASRGG